MTSFWDIIRIPFGYLLEFLYNLTSNYGVALILFAVIVKIILVPLSMKSKKSTMKMTRLSPMLKDLERRYGDDKAKYQQETMRLYKEEGVSPTGGCIWSFIPLAILIPLYQVIRQPMVYMMHLSADTATSIVDSLLNMGVNLGTSTYYHQLVAASKLPQYLDQIKSAVPALSGVTIPTINFNFLGCDLSAIPNFRFWTLAGWAAIGLFLIPLVSGLSNWATMWVTQKFNSSVATNEKGEKGQVADAAASSMKTMIMIMPFFSIYIGYTMPAGISIYWIAQAVLGVAQEWILTKYYRKIYDAEDAIKRTRAAEQASIEAEKERIRAERRALYPEGYQDPNTSKKKLKVKEKTEKGPLIEGKLTPEERAALKEEKAPSGNPNRPNSRGRAYEASRYGRDGEELADEETPTEIVDDYKEPEEAVEVVDDYVEEATFETVDGDVEEDRDAVEEEPTEPKTEE
ncbi:MAG: YidC/Oxa1 family membrane protein insertase [Oscillospiraceae bacterium]|nr:YidC/Oxa1 family membrane protein insertase [Oscillospiraceae bacterium]